MKGFSMNERNIKVRISDPWDFGTEHGNGPFDATIIKSTKDKIVIKFIKPFQYKDTNCQYFVASCRHQNQFDEDFPNKTEISVNLTKIEFDDKSNDDLFDLSKWRGGVVLLATVSTL